MKKRIAIVDGIRTPLCKAGTDLAKVAADDLGAFVVREVVQRNPKIKDLIDEVIFGNVGQPTNAANISRVIALKAGLPQHLPAYTVHRNCASGMESLTSAANKILIGHGEVMVVGGTESMSNYPLLFGKKMTELFARLMKAKTAAQKIQVLLSFRPGYLKPVIAMVEGLTDPVCGLNMGQTAEVLSREFHIDREEQDAFALLSHKRAAAADSAGILAQEILPFLLPPEYKKVLLHDNGIRHEQTMEALAKMRPYFDRTAGTVTVANACPVTDGAVALIVCSEEKARELDITPLGYLREYAYAGLDPTRMGLGPVFSTAKVLKRAGMTMGAMDLIELNEAFAAQVIANERAFASDEFALKYLNQSSAVGAIDREKLNVNGGAIALGHPVGATGARMILTLLKELRRRNKQTGLATLCIGGGQGAALILEVE